jgi:peptidoglycan/LPS O-acetylase OafA/YrhL
MNNRFLKGGAKSGLGSAMRGRLAEIDMLRGYAVAMVVFLHLNLSNPYRGLVVQGILRSTDMAVGVDLFFVISGFVICRALSDLWDVETAADARRLKNFPLIFYRKRFARLWPASALWLVLNVVLAGLFHGSPFWPVPLLVAVKAVFGFVYLYNFQELRDPGPLGYFWSLSVEWQFYLLLPLFLLFVRNNFYRVGLLIAALAVSVVAQPGGANWQFLRFDGLVFGILLYVLLDRLELAVPRYRVLEQRLFRPLVTLALLLAVMVVPAYVADRRIGFVFANALGAVLVALAATDRGYISGLGIAPLVRWLGSRSYSIYLVHMPVVLSLESYDFFDWPAPHANHRVNFELGWYYGVSIVLIALFAELTYRWIELPSHRASRAIGYEPAFKRAA